MSYLSRQHQLRVWGVLLAMLGLRLGMAWAAPLANDEAYYWDWGRALQLSYLDHPPGVAWLGLMSHFVGGTLGVRMLVPFAHLIGTLFLLGCLPYLKADGRPDGRDVAVLLFITEVVPAFHFEGILLLPDAGLLPALAAALYCTLRGSSGGIWTLAAGVALGVSGLFKYHAAPLAVGMALGVLARHPWREMPKVFLSFLLPAAAAAALVTTPVWIWNALHGMASFRFQSDHGFGGLEFSPLAAGRFYLGQLVILTPALAFGGAVWVGKSLYPQLTSRGRLLVPFLGFLPLAVLLDVTAFGKQLLPHWIAPAYWVLAPAFALHVARDYPWGLRYRINAAFAAVLSFVLPWIIAAAPLRHGLVAAFRGSPGPLSELTLWEPLSETIATDPALKAAMDTTIAAHLSASKDCPEALTVASLRWFWTAQLAFNLPGHPRVHSLDFNHPSYYSFRDSLPDLAGCPVLIVGDKRHLDSELLSRAVVMDQQLDLVVPTHADTAVVAILGTYRSKDELTKLAHDLR